MSPEAAAYFQQKKHKSLSNHYYLVKSGTDWQVKKLNSFDWVIKKITGLLGLGSVFYSHCRLSCFKKNFEKEFLSNPDNVCDELLAAVASNVLGMPTNSKRNGILLNVLHNQAAPAKRKHFEGKASHDGALETFTINYDDVSCEDFTKFMENAPGSKNNAGTKQLLDLVAGQILTHKPTSHKVTQSIHPKNPDELKSQFFSKKITQANYEIFHGKMDEDDHGNISGDKMKPDSEKIHTVFAAAHQGPSNGLYLGALAQDEHHGAITDIPYACCKIRANGEAIYPMDINDKEAKTFYPTPYLIDNINQVSEFKMYRGVAVKKAELDAIKEAFKPLDAKQQVSHSALYVAAPNWKHVVGDDKVFKHLAQMIKNWCQAFEVVNEEHAEKPVMTGGWGTGSFGVPLIASVATQYVAFSLMDKKMEYYHIGDGTDEVEKVFQWCNDHLVGKTAAEACYLVLEKLSEK